MAYPQPYLTNPSAFLWMSISLPLKQSDLFSSTGWHRSGSLIFPLGTILQCSLSAQGLQSQLPVQTSPAGSQSLWDTETTWKTQAGTCIPCPPVWKDGGSILCQRKGPYLVPLPHFACKSIFLLGHSERVGFRYLFQLWRLSEMSVWKRECYMCSQGFHNNCIIPILLSFQIAM